jgi:hypothetical protein
VSRSFQVICAVSLLVILLALVGAAWTYRPRLVILQTLNTAPMSDVETVDLTRQALHEVGEDVTLFRPRTNNGQDLFARNTMTPSDGYVATITNGMALRIGFNSLPEDRLRDLKAMVGDD